MSNDNKNHKPAHGHHEHKPAEKVAPTAAYIEGCTDPVELATIAQEYGDLATAATTRIGALAAAAPAATEVAPTTVIAATETTLAAASGPAGSVPIAATEATHHTTHHKDGHVVHQKQETSLATVEPKTVVDERQATINRYNKLGPVVPGLASKA